MKYATLVLILVVGSCLSLGCDHKKNDTDTRSCWKTVDESNTFYPVKFHPHVPLKKLSQSDVAFIKSALEAAPVDGEYDETQFRTICTVGKWVMTDYKAANHHTPWFLRCEFGGVWVDISKPVTLEFQTQRCPKPQPTASWHPYTIEEIEEIENYDPNNTDHWGYWIYTEAECPNHDH